jgi:hypothetical protein
MAVTMILLAVAFAIAAPQESAVDGRWQGTMDTANGSITVTYNFKAEGQVLTGTETSPMFSRSISEGKVNGDKISFKTTVNGNTIEHEGTVSGDTIQLKNHGPYGEFGMTIAREKKSAP